MGSNIDLPAWIAALSALAAVLIGVWNNRKLKESIAATKEVHISLNSRLTQLLHASVAQATAEATAAEKQRAKGE